MPDDVPVPPILVREFESLTWVDPKQVLINLRWLERNLPFDIDERVRRLRTNQLKELREARIAALFDYGLSVTLLGTQVAVAKVEKSGYDFIVRWIENDTRRFYPVQLKELPPEELNPIIELTDILSRLGKYDGKSDLAVLVHLNRTGRFEYSPSIDRPTAKIRELWYLGCDSSDQMSWFLYGNVLDPLPEKRSFRYPEGQQNVT